MKNYDDFAVNALMDITSRSELVFVRGEGSWLWDHQHAGIEPDIMTLGKMLGGGVPLATFVAKDS